MRNKIKMFIKCIILKHSILFVLLDITLFWIQEERTMLAKELSSLRDQREQLKAEVEKYRECDPQVVEEIRKFVLLPKSS